MPPSPGDVFAPIRPRQIPLSSRYSFICCQCNRMHRNRDAGCPACAHSLPYCLNCTPKTLPHRWTSPTGGRVWGDELIYARREKGWRPDGGKIGENGLVWHGVDEGFREKDAKERPIGQRIPPLIRVGGVICIVYFAISSLY